MVGRAGVCGKKRWHGWVGLIAVRSLPERNHRLPSHHLTTQRGNPKEPAEGLPARTTRTGSNAVRSGVRHAPGGLGAALQRPHPQTRSSSAEQQSQ